MTIDLEIPLVSQRNPKGYLGIADGSLVKNNCPESRPLRNRRKSPFVTVLDLDSKVIESLSTIPNRPP